MNTSRPSPVLSLSNPPRALGGSGRWDNISIETKDSIVFTKKIREEEAAQSDEDHENDEDDTEQNGKVIEEEQDEDEEGVESLPQSPSTGSRRYSLSSEHEDDVDGDGSERPRAASGEGVMRDFDAPYYSKPYNSRMTGSISNDNWDDVSILTKEESKDTVIMEIESTTQLSSVGPPGITSTPVSKHSGTATSELKGTSFLPSPSKWDTMSILTKEEEGGSNMEPLNSTSLPTPEAVVATTQTPNSHQKRLQANSPVFYCRSPSQATKSATMRSQTRRNSYCSSPANTSLNSMGSIKNSNDRNLPSTASDIHSMASSNYRKKNTHERRLSTSSISMLRRNNGEGSWAYGAVPTSQNFHQNNNYAVGDNNCTATPRSAKSPHGDIIAVNYLESPAASDLTLTERLLATPSTIATNASGSCNIRAVQQSSPNSADGPSRLEVRMANIRAANSEKRKLSVPPSLLSTSNKSTIAPTPGRGRRFSTSAVGEVVSDYYFANGNKGNSETMPSKNDFKTAASPVSSIEETRVSATSAKKFGRRFSTGMTTSQTTAFQQNIQLNASHPPTGLHAYKPPPTPKRQAPSVEPRLASSANVVTEPKVSIAETEQPKAQTQGTSVPTAKETSSTKNTSAPETKLSASEKGKYSPAAVVMALRPKLMYRSASLTRLHGYEPLESSSNLFEDKEENGKDLKQSNDMKDYVSSESQYAASRKKKSLLQLTPRVGLNRKQSSSGSINSKTPRSPVQKSSTLTSSPTSAGRKATYRTLFFQRSASASQLLRPTSSSKTVRQSGDETGEDEGEPERGNTGSSRKSSNDRNRKRNSLTHLHSPPSVLQSSVPGSPRRQQQQQHGVIGNSNNSLGSPLKGSLNRSESPASSMRQRPQSPRKSPRKHHHHRRSSGSHSSRSKPTQPPRLKGILTDPSSRNQSRPSKTVSFVNKDPVEIPRSSNSTIDQEEVGEDIWWSAADIEKMRTDVEALTGFFKMYRSDSIQSAAQVLKSCCSKQGANDVSVEMDDDSFITKLLSNATTTSYPNSVDVDAPSVSVEESPLQLVFGPARGLESDILPMLTFRRYQSVRILLQAQNRTRDSPQRDRLMAIQYQQSTRYAQIWARLLAYGDEQHSLSHTAMIMEELKPN